MKNQCPHCGAPLPEEASFCPHCARSLNRRVNIRRPFSLSSKVLRLAALLILIAAVCAAGYFLTRPKTYDAMGEFTYSDSDGSYQLLLSYDSTDRYTPISIFETSASAEESYRFPCWLYVNSWNTGEDAGEMFRKKIKDVQVRVEQPEGGVSPVLCSEPQPMDFNTGAVLGSLIDFTRESPSSSQILWTITMKNGDVIHLGMDLSITATQIYNYSFEDMDLTTVQAVQDLIDRTAEETDYRDAVNIYLPPVTYTEPLILRGRTFNLFGSQSEAGRTTFTAGIQMKDDSYEISYFTGIDFVGDGTGVAISSAGRAWTKECSFVNWKTAFLAYGDTWINATDCVFEDNEIGIHYNSSTVVGPSDTHFTGNTFTGNGTAVLLEAVPAEDVTLDFSQCVFEDNGTDLDNLCGQPVDLSEAVFH